jgi:tetratricopeptide (TPR) repeat protein
MSYSLLAGGLSMTGQNDESDKIGREAIRLADKLAAESPDVSAYKELQRWTHGGASGRYEMWGRPADALESLRTALKCQEALLQKYPQVGRYQYSATNYRGAMGDLLWVMNRRKEATEEYRFAYELGKDPDRLRPDVQAQYAWFLATSPVNEFRDPKRSIEITNRTIQRNPNNGEYRLNLAAAQFADGDYQGCLRSLDEADKRGKNYAYAEPYHALYRAMAYHRLGNTEQARKQYDDAVAEIVRTRTWFAEARMLCAEVEQVLGLPPTKSFPPLTGAVPP